MAVIDEYKPLTDEELEDYVSRVLVQLEPTLVRQTVSVIKELLDCRARIKKGELVEIPPLVSYNEHLKKYEVLGYNLEIYVKEYCKTEAEAKEKLKELQNER